MDRGSHPGIHAPLSQATTKYYSRRGPWRACYVALCPLLGFALLRLGDVVLGTQVHPTCKSLQPPTPLLQLGSFPSCGAYHSCAKRACGQAAASGKLAACCIEYHQRPSSPPSQPSYLQLQHNDPSFSTFLPTRLLSSSLLFPLIPPSPGQRHSLSCSLCSSTLQQPKQQTRYDLLDHSTSCLLFDDNRAASSALRQPHDSLTRRPFLFAIHNTRDLVISRSPKTFQLEA